MIVFYSDDTGFNPSCIKCHNSEEIMKPNIKENELTIEVRS